MRVTVVSPFDPDPAAGAAQGAHVGGVERVLENLSTHLARRGHEVTVVCSANRAGKEVRPNGVTVSRILRQSTFFRAPIARLDTALTRDTDVVHVPATYPFTTGPVLRRADRLGVPSVLDFHFEPVLDSWLGRAGAKLYGMVGPRSYELAKAVLVRSQAYARVCPSLANVAEESWRVVPNGVDPLRFRPLNETQEGTYLLFVGRLVPYKGLSTLLHALALMPPNLPLVIAGDGPLRQELEALARQLRVDVRFAGRVADADLPGLYRGARLTILPSINSQEAFGMTLLESMACGTPVVASDLPGVAEVAALGGFVAPPGDAHALGLQIHGAMAPGALARGRALASPVRAAYSWDAVTDRLVDVYREILDGPRQARTGRSLAVRQPAHPGRHSIL